MTPETGLPILEPFLWTCPCWTSTDNVVIHILIVHFLICKMVFLQRVHMPQKKRPWCQNWRSWVTWETTWTSSISSERARLEVRHKLTAGCQSWWIMLLLLHCICLFLYCLLHMNDTCNCFLLRSFPKAYFFRCRAYASHYRVLLLWRPPQLPSSKERLLYLLQARGGLLLPQRGIATRGWVRLFFVLYVRT